MRDFLKMLLASCLGVVLASLVVLFIFFAMLGSLVSEVMTSFGGGEKAKSGVELKQESVLLLDLEGVVSEKPKEDVFLSNLFSSEEPRNYTLSEVLQAVEIARENPKIEAIVLDLEQANIGFAAGSEIRDALERFQESGKKVYAYSEFYSTRNYYVSSVADEVLAGPMGSLAISGLSSTTAFYPGLLKKLGVEMQVFKVGTFKSAVEPFTEEQLSPANRLQIETYLGGLWEGIKGEIAASRGIEADVIQRFADEGKFLDYNTAGLEVQLIDSLVNRIDLGKVLAQKVNGDEGSAVNEMRVRDVLRLKKRKHDAEGKVAVLYAEGSIVTSDPTEDNPFANGSFITDQLVEELRELADDDDVDAIVVRVNSGGGALVTSELIAQEVVRTKERKPVVFSMGNAAASGGYWISSHASSIVASPYTLTGSIGIFGISPNLSGTFHKLGMKHDTVKTAEFADMASGNRRMTPQESALMQKHIEEGYDFFLERVSTGRGMTKEQVDEVGQGCVWLGAKAYELGLVDKLGGLQVAIDEAARLAGLESYSVVHEIKHDDPWKKMFGLNISTSVHYLRMSETERAMWRVLTKLQLLSGVQAIPGHSLEVVDAVEISSFQPESKSFLRMLEQ